MRLLYAGIVLVAIFACSSGLPAPEPEINDDGNLVYLEESDFIKEGGKYICLKKKQFF